MVPGSDVLGAGQAGNDLRCRGQLSPNLPELIGLGDQACTVEFSGEAARVPDSQDQGLT